MHYACTIYNSPSSTEILIFFYLSNFVSFSTSTYNFVSFSTSTSSLSTDHTCTMHVLFTILPLPPKYQYFSIFPTLFLSLLLPTTLFHSLLQLLHCQLTTNIDNPSLYKQAYACVYFTLHTSIHMRTLLYMTNPIKPVYFFICLELREKWETNFHNTPQSPEDVNIICNM